MRHTKHSGKGLVDIACGKKSVKNVLSHFIGHGQLQDNKKVNKNVIYLGCALKTGNTLTIIYDNFISANIKRSDDLSYLYLFKKHISYHHILFFTQFVLK